jgi:hypothetical protein
MLDRFPDDIILELGQSLERADLLNLYAVSRRCRDVVMDLLDRTILVTCKNLHEILLLVAEDRHFARSVSTLVVLCNDECSFAPKPVPAAIADIQQRIKGQLSHVRLLLSHRSFLHIIIRS